MFNSIAVEANLEITLISILIPGNKTIRYYKFYQDLNSWVKLRYASKRWIAVYSDHLVNSARCPLHNALGTFFRHRMLEQLTNSNLLTRQSFLPHFAPPAYQS